MNGIDNIPHLNSNLTFLDYVPYPDMKTYYKKSMVLINTSDFEGFPNTFIEAAMHHTPVISLNSDPNRMLSKHQCGVFCKGDFSLMVEELEKLLNSEKELGRMGDNAFRYARENHQLDDAVAKINCIIRNGI